ncbi:MAG: hypothetical protein RL375_2585 [Pseudomonadota bacterium]
MNQRTRVLIGLAAISGLWALWAATRPPEVATASMNKPRASGSGTATVRKAPRDNGHDGQLAVRGQLAEEALGDPFQAPVVKAPRIALVQPAPPPPPPVVQAPPPPPPPPPRPVLPYRFVGMLADRDGSDARVFLMMGDKMLMARAGETLEGGWRLDNIGQRELQFVRPSDNTTLKLSVEEGV